MKKKKTEIYKLSKASGPAVLRESAVAEWGHVVPVREAKAHLSALLERVAAGQKVTITSNGIPKAVLSPVALRHERKAFAGMGDFLLKQPIHGGPSADEIIREDRDARGW